MAIALGGFSAVQLNDGFSDFSNFIYLFFFLPALQFLPFIFFYLKLK